MMRIVNKRITCTRAFLERRVESAFLAKDWPRVVWAAKRLIGLDRSQGRKTRGAMCLTGGKAA